MSLSRALVFGINARFLFAAGAVAASVAYALFAGASTSGLRSAQEVLQEEILTERGVYAQRGFAPFPTTSAPEGTETLLVHARYGNLTLATTRTAWPFGPNATVPGPLAPPLGVLLLGERTLELAPAQFVDGAPGDWIFVEPAVFDGRFPQLVGQATVAVGVGARFIPAPAVDEFYARGSQQITEGLAFVALTSVFVASVVAGVATRLEVLARAPDYALLEALGATRIIRWLILARAAVTVAAGTAAGAAFAFGAAEYASRAQGKLALAIPPTYGAATVGAVLLSATAVAAIVGWRTVHGDISRRLSRRGLPGRRFPGRIRFLFVTPRMAPVFAVALAVTIVTTSVVLGAVAAPAKIMDPGEGLDVVGSSTGNPLRGSVPRSGAEAANAAFPDRPVSPETFVPTVVKNRPVLVRGVHFVGWARLADAELEEGSWPSAANEAAAGHRAAERLRVQVGDVLRVPGAYRPVLHEVRVTAIFAADGLEVDELLVPLDTAASLAALDHLTVNLVRLRNPTPETVDYVTDPGVKVLQIRVEPDPPLEGLQAQAIVTVMNVDRRFSSRALQLTVNGVPTVNLTVRLEPLEQDEVSLPFRVPAGTFLNLTVNPTLNTTPVPAGLRVRLPTVATVEDGIPVNVTLRNGLPASNVTLRTPWGSTSASGGSALVPVAGLGRFEVIAESADGLGAAESFATRREWLSTSHLEVDRLDVDATGNHNDTHGSYEVIVHVTNYGGQVYAEPLPIRLQGGTAHVTTDVPPFSTKHLVVEARAPYGPVSVTVANLTSTLVLQHFAPQEDPAPAARTVADVIAQKAPATFETAQARSDRFLNDIFDRIGVAVNLVVIATVLHGATVVWTAVRRESAERRELSGTLRAIGASEGQIRLRATRDALLASLAGIALGLLLVPVALWIGSLLDVPSAFGHRLDARPTFEVLLRISAFFVLVAILSALATIRAKPPEPSAPRPRRLRELSA